MSKYRTCAFFVDNVRCLWCPVSGHINRSSTLSEVFVGKTIDYRDAAYWKDIVKAKQAFLAGDQAAAEGRVRPLVLESWKRCLPFLGTKLAKKRTCLEQSALTHVMQQNRELLACAIPVRTDRITDQHSRQKSAKKYHTAKNHFLPLIST